MLSFKDGKAMKPIYDYYVETDLDTIDDQPIDYSKRYDDQLADDVCGSSSAKKRHLSTPSENVVPNKIPGDELKVYCIEGTPLLISSASSLCDLHEIGALLQASESEQLKEHAGQKPCFQEPYSNQNEEPSLSTKCDESPEDSKFEPDQRESKEGITQENTSSRTDETFSKASSPLMFSRSSSICSLNSFEQHSIVDDRSSVSMFSNLASGIISPSEIPDSPGEAMSPFIHKRQSEFVFPPNDHQSKSLDPVLAKLKAQSTAPFNDQTFEDIPEDHIKIYNHESRSQPQGLQQSFNDEAFEDIPEDNLKVYNDEGDCCSVSNLSALSIQASSLSRVSVAVFHKSSFPIVEHKSSIRISCSIVTGNAELQSIAEDTDAPKVEPAKNHVKSFNSYTVAGLMDVDDDQDCVKSFSNYAATGSEMMEHNEDQEHVKSFGYTELMDDDEDQDEKINFSCMAENEEDCKDEGGSPVGDFGFGDGFKPCLGSFEEPIKENNFLHGNESPDYSKDNSDDDCDALLEECIKSGMPTSNESLHQHAKQSSTDSCLSDQQLKPKEGIQDQNISHSDCDTSDSEEEDLLLQSCIQLGMPQKSPSKEPIASNDSSNHLKSSNPLTKSPQNFAKEMDITEVSDDEEYDPLLQQIIQLGKPTNSPKESCSSNANSSIAYTSGRLDLDYRDNRPDGTSDEEDDDDDILTECIQAGMPKPKTDQSKSPYSLPMKSPSGKPQLHSHRLSPASEDRAAYMSSFAGPHQPFRKSPTNEYRSAHLKSNQQRKSPTKEDRPMPLPSYTRLHQRLPHRRSPTAEDRAMLASTLGGQQLQYPRKSPSKISIPSNAGQHRKSPAAPDRTLIFNSTNQSRQMSSAAPDRVLFSNLSNRPRQVMSPAAPDRTSSSNSANQLRQMSSAGDGFQKKYQNWMHNLRDSKIEPAPIPDATCTYRTEDTPILSPSASVSDLSTLSFSEDRMYLDCSLNNSRNSDCSSESEEDELLLQCIRSGMPSEKRALA